MRALHRFRPSPAMVVASIALLVGLTGTGIAAVSALPKNSVGTAQLKRNAVTSAKVLNRSLLAVDFAPGQVPPGPQGPAGLQGPPGPQGPAGVAAPGYVAQVVSDTSRADVASNSTSWTDLPGANEPITVPTGETARLYVWFSAESACYGGTGYCGVRITVDGNEIEPASDSDFAFDSTDAGDETSTSWESHSIVRVSETLTAGSHTIKVQGRTSSGATTLRLDDWAMVVQRVRLS